MTTHQHHRGGAIEQFEARVEAHVAKGRTRADATRRVVTEDPELHQAYLREFNEQRNQRIVQREQAADLMSHSRG